MIFKFFNLATIFIITFLFSFSQEEKKVFLNDYYIIEKEDEIQKLVYTKSYNAYKDILYTNVVFD
jgi:hypothetical protein